MRSYRIIVPGHPEVPTTLAFCPAIQSDATRRRWLRRFLGVSRLPRRTTIVRSGSSSRRDEELEGSTG